LRAPFAWRVAVEAPRDPPDLRVRKALLGPKGQPVRKVLPDRRAPPVHKEVLGSKDLRAHKGSEAKQAPQALPDRLARRVSRDRQALCATSRMPAILSHAMMAKFLSLPFARKVLRRFKDPLRPNAVPRAAWLDSACRNSPAASPSRDGNAVGR
jgi:hypothetical protein